MKYVILAGGSGTRLWPLSRKNISKQFIDLIDQNTMLQNTALRVSKDEGRDIYVISNGESKFTIIDQLKEVLKKFSECNIILEPCQRNTAPAIAYGTLFFDEEEVLAILSSDHHIQDKKEFNRILDEAEKIANNGYIVTIGIVPDSPKTGYGYIKKSNEKILEGFKVEKFVEKPNLETAKKYIEDGNFFWNAGIFIFKIKTFLEELKIHSPNIYQTLIFIKEKISRNEKITIDDFEQFEKISIDYALMEKSNKICVIPGNFGWSDVGSFKSLYEILPKDENNNAFKTKLLPITINTKNCLIIDNGEKKIATIGVDNLTIVDTPDALLVTNNDYSENVKEIVDILLKEKSDLAINHKTVYRPWGSYTILDEGPNYKVKQLYIRPEQSISLQYHYHRSENWTVASGIAEVVKGDEIITLKPSETVFIPATTPHKLTNPSKVRVLKIIEVQTGEYLGEDDIIRLEDKYNRC